MSGRLVHDAAAVQGASSAGYLQVDTGTAFVREMKAECAWAASSIGAVAFVVPSLAAGYDWAYPTSLPVAGFHLTAYGNGVWNCGVWNPGPAALGGVGHSVQPGTATSFTLTVQTTTPSSTQVTGSISAGASAVTVKTAVEALSNISVGEVTVTKSESGNYGFTWASGLGTVTLTATPTGGTMGMAAPLPSNASNTIAGVVTYGAGVTTYADYTTAGRYATVWDNKMRWLEAYLFPETDEMLLFFPDGTNTGIIRHPGIGLWSSGRAVFELFESNSGQVDVPATYGRISVSSQRIFRDTPAASKADVVVQLESSKTVTLYDGGNATTSDIVTSGSVPPGTQFLELVLIAGGPGGGSGACQPADTAASGGGAGGSGGIITAIIPASQLGTSWAATIGKYGVGGAAVSSTASGNSGSAAGLSKFTTGSTAYQCFQASPGGGGSNAGVGTAGGAGGPFAATGPSSQVGAVGANGTGVTSTLGMSSPGAGGSISAGNTAFNGGTGGSNLVRGYTGGTAGVVDTTAPGRGTDITGTPLTSTPAGVPGPGPGGGAASITTAAQGGANAAGWGMGGGGGGASRNGNASGKGGDGKGGYLIVRAHLF